MHTHICDVVPRLKFKLFQLFLRSVRVLPLVSVGLRLVLVYENILPCNYLVFPKNLPSSSSALAFNSPIFFAPVLVQGGDFSAIKKSHLFAAREACSSSLSIHQTILLIKINTNPVVVNGGCVCVCVCVCRLVLQPLNIGIPSVPAADLFNYV